MSQRLGVAAAILGNPKYLLLDEPANGLDPEGIAWLRDFLKNYASQGNAVFVCSHLLSEMALMADNLVVIGKGKLITSTSVKELVSSNGHSSVFVRAANNKSLEQLLKKQNGLYIRKENKGLVVTGTNTDQIGKTAFAAGIALLELSSHNASLEEAFLELTADAQEFQAKTGKDKA